MDLMEYIEALPLHGEVIRGLKKKIKQREASIHVHAKVAALMKAATITKYLSRGQREVYFKNELSRVRDEGINLIPKKKMEISDL